MVVKTVKGQKVNVTGNHLHYWTRIDNGRLHVTLSIHVHLPDEVNWDENVKTALHWSCHIVLIFIAS